MERIRDVELRGVTVLAVDCVLHLLDPQWQGGSDDRRMCKFKQIYPVDPTTKATFVVFEFPRGSVQE